MSSTSSWGNDSLPLLQVEDEFRYLQKKRNVVVEMQSMRLKNTRYIAELVKFQLMPLHMTLYCFKSSLDHFTTTDIEVLANLLENCGRYLLRTPETAQRMSTIASPFCTFHSLTDFR